MSWLSRVSYDGGLRCKIKEFVSRRLKSGSSVKRPQESFTFSPAGEFKTSEPTTNWYHTHDGRKKMAGRVGAGGSMFLLFSSFGLNILGTTVLKEQYEKRAPGQAEISLAQRAAEKEGPEGVPVPVKINRMFTNNQDRVGLNDDNMDRMEVFVTDVLDPVGFGCSFTAHGGVVGVPLHQTWTSLDEVDLENVRIKPTFNRWFQGYQIPSTAEPQDIENLKKNFVLSEEAVKFYLAKNMHIAGSWQAVIMTILPASLWFFHYLQAINVNDRLGLFKKPRFFRFTIQGMLGCMSLFLFIGLKNICESFTKKGAIDQVLRTPKEAEAAIEFYTKSLERNKLLRKVLGSEGEYYFEEDGEIVGYGYEMPELVSTAAYLEYAREKLAKILAEEDNLE